MQGLLGNTVIQGLLGGGGPMAVRARNQQEMAQMLPRSAGGMMGAPAAPQQQPYMAQAISGIGGNIADAISERVAASEANEKAKARVNSILGMGNEGRNAAMQAGGGPTNAAAQMQNADTPESRLARMGVPEKARPLVMGAIDSGDWQTADKVLTNFALQGPQDAPKMVNTFNPSTGQWGQPIPEGSPLPQGHVLAGAFSPEKRGAPKPPQTREVKLGGQIVTEEWDPNVGQWRKVATAPRSVGESGAPDITLFHNGEKQEVPYGSPLYENLKAQGWSAIPKAGGADPDFNKAWSERRDPETGEAYTTLTPKGIAERVEAPVEQATALRGYFDKVRDGIRLFRDEGNAQALLSSMITFQKALDDGAVVREGDIVLQRSAEGLSDRISGFLERIETGAPVSKALADQMMQTMRSFVSQGLNSYKSVVDPFMQKGREEWGNRSMSSVLPQATYDRLFTLPEEANNTPTGASPPPMIGDPQTNQTGEPDMSGAPVPMFSDLSDPRWQRFSKMSPSGRAKFLGTLKGNEPLQYLFTLEEQEGAAAVDEIDRILRGSR